MSLIKKSAIFLTAIIGIIFLFNSVVMPWYVRHNTLVKVPSVTGLSFVDAKHILDENSLEGKQGDIRYDQNKPIGMVIEQFPPADQMVKDGRRIYLIVSGGEQLYDVPNLAGRSVREAKFILAQRNLELQEVSSKPSAQYPSGIVLEQIEQAGSKLKKGTKVGVVVSIGMEAGDIKVPDLAGKNIDEAKKILLAAKLQVGKITSQPSTSVPLNAIIDQYPKANSMAKENDRIDIFVNKEQKKKEIIPKSDEEMNGLEEVKPNPEKGEEKKPKEEKPKEPEKKKEPDLKKDNKDDKSKQPEKKEEKKKTDKKDGEKKDDGGTKF